MGKKILTFLSYVMVAIIASVITICLLGGESIPVGNKLVEL